MTEHERMESEPAAEPNSVKPLGPGKWVSKQEAAVHYKRGERAIEKWVKAGKIRTEHYRTNAEGKVEIFVPETKLTEPRPNLNSAADEPKPNKFRLKTERPIHRVPNQAEPSSDIVRSLSVEITEASRSQREMYERLLKEIDARTEIEKKVLEQSTQLANLNNERMSYNTSLQRASDDRAEVKRLHEEMKDLREEKAKSDAAKEAIKEQTAKVEAEKEALAAENAKLKEKKSFFDWFKG